MRVLMNGEAPVSYAQIYVQSWPGLPDVSGSFGGQRNGLCGGAVPGALSLVTGLHTGEVGFRVELHDEAPPLDETWEEIVEVSFRPTGAVSLVAWGGYAAWPLDLDAVDYRVRYSGARMDEAHRLGIPEGEEFEPDRYLLQFWPGPPEPDRVVKQTSETAAYWHRAARKAPPPAPRKEKPQRLPQARQVRAAPEVHTTVLAHGRGGSQLSERLQQSPDRALTVEDLDPSLVDALTRADPVTQRQIARWAVRRAYAEARLTEVEWIAPALAAMDRGAPLPPPFDDNRRAWDLLLTDEQVPHTLATSPDGRHDNCLQQAMAFPAIFSARGPDPLEAALDALRAAKVTFGYGRHGVLFAEVRQAFPALAEEEER